MYHTNERLTRATFMSTKTNKSTVSAISGVTGITALPEVLAGGKVRLPTSQDITFNGMSEANGMGWFIFTYNSLSAFVIGMIIAGSFNNSIAEVR